MTPTITPEQAAALATVPPDVTAYLAVKGERRLCLRSDQVAGGSDTCSIEYIPPADLAALVEQRCETCRGRRWIGPDPFKRLGHPCWDCHDGTPLHSLWTYDALLPVISVESWDGTTPAVVIDADQVYVVDGTWSNGEPNATDITVFGTPEPGHFVLAVTRRTP